MWSTTRHAVTTAPARFEIGTSFTMDRGLPWRSAALPLSHRGARIGRGAGLGIP